ncbi:uncharacterized protein LOC128878949 isoform X2 [Hylaeus volcanicus]|uniref:uncharacterized protein LOC128878949 isoform X2 n=1 Tax=Hylaeus volcanicus TaxID=313075 RepID=UPI0023B84E26|nr:uncharacterized protein LOC128878949 isoform X2 [Hylaeus volcanicus]
MHSVLKIETWNVRSLGNKIEELKIIIRNYDILCITEAWITNYDFVRIKDYKLIYNDNMKDIDRKSQRQPGTGIVIIYKNNLNITTLEIITNGELYEYIKCSILDQENVKILNLTVLYRMHKIKLSYKDWLDCLKKIDIKDDDILVGDFNARNTLWNCSSSDWVGDNLARALEYKELFVANENTVSRRGVGVAPSNIDLIITRIQTIDKNIQSNFSCNLRKDSNRLYNRQKVNWSNIRQTLSDKEQEIKTEFQKKNGANEKYYYWKEQLVNTFSQDEHQKNRRTEDQNIRNTRNTRNKTKAKPKENSNRGNRAKWWNEECLRAWTDWKTSNRILWNTGTVEDYNIMVGFRNRWKKLKKEKKEKQWIELTEEISGEKNLTKIWKKVKGLKDYFTTNKTKMDCRVRGDLEAQEIEKLVSKNNNADILKDRNHQFNSYQEFPYADIWNKEVSNIEVLHAIEAGRSKKSAPGLDKIDYKTLSELPLFMKILLSELMKDSWEEGMVPDDWNLTKPNLALREKDL